jgi:hypothetical protein
VGLFGRRDEPLHERLAREGGMLPWQEAGIQGQQRPREADATVTTNAKVEGEEARFVSLPDGTILIEDGPDDVSPLATAVEAEVQPPYRARAVRREGDLWVVQASRIQVLELPDAPDGDSLELTSEGLLVDGRQASGWLPELAALGDVVRAQRLDGDLWEVQADTL